MDHELRLLVEIEKSFLGIIAAITQTPSDIARRGRTAASIATAKVTGAAATAGVFGIVSTLGTAGTGTAIATLSGAASTSATLAWLGGLVGGGMAAGAVVLPVVGIAAGAAATMAVRKRYFTQQRTLEELLPFEREILFATYTLLSPISDILHGEKHHPTKTELKIFAHDGLRPLLSRLHKHLGRPTDRGDAEAENERFASTLERKHYINLVRCFNDLHKHEATLSQPVKLTFAEKFTKFCGQLIRRSFKTQRQILPETHFSSVALAVTFQRLLSDTLTTMNLEQNLVLDALRRSTNDLRDASVQELATYVQGLSPESLRGVMSNTKGIYHEMLFVQEFNAENSGVTARLMEATNYPGADVQFISDGAVIREVQLKAVSSPTLVLEHLRRYPDVEIMATEETAAIMDGIDSSGFRNAILSREVADRMEDLKGEGLLDEISDGLLTSALVRSGFVIWSVLKKRRLEGLDLSIYMKDAGVAVGTATMVDGVIAMASN